MGSTHKFQAASLIECTPYSLLSIVLEGGALGQIALSGGSSSPALPRCKTITNPGR